MLIKNVSDVAASTFFIQEMSGKQSIQKNQNLHASASSIKLTKIAKKSVLLSLKDLVLKKWLQPVLVILNSNSVQSGT